MEKLKDKDLLKYIVITNYNRHSITSSDIGRITARVIAKDDGVISISYQYDDYPYAFGSDSFSLPLGRFEGFAEKFAQLKNSK